MIPVADTGDARPVGDADALVAEASELSFEVVDVAGFLDHVADVAKGQLGRLDTAQEAAGRVRSANDVVHGAAEDVAGTTRTSISAAEASVTQIREAAQATAGLAEWVSSLTERLQTVEETLASIRKANAEISSIATQVNMLAINAKIEAAHAGRAGRGFAVVADSINELSRKTAETAEGIGTAVGDLSSWSRDVTGEAGDLHTKVGALVAGAGNTDAAMRRIMEGLGAALTGTAAIADAATRSEHAMADFVTTFDSIGDGIRSTAEAVGQARDRADAMIDRSERIVQRTVTHGGETTDTRFIERVMADAAELSRRLEAAVDAGRIALGDLFSERYEPIAGSDPQQLRAPFTDLTDALFPEVQEAALDLDPRVVFCAGVDRNGYLPTHNAKFSRPQGNDPVWNAAHSRNRRIFDDRVGLKAGRNSSPFLLQVYRRDMGGGEFRMMKDVSAPIRVKGRHWGGLRLAYTA